MNTKKSLGHFPFGNDAPEKSDYAFIPNIVGLHESGAAFSQEAQSRPDISMDKQDMPVEKGVRSKKADSLIAEFLLKQIKGCPRAVKSSCISAVSKATGIFSN